MKARGKDALKFGVHRVSKCNLCDLASITDLGISIADIFILDTTNELFGMHS
jgi:hypothetical protein